MSRNTIVSPFGEVCSCRDFNARKQSVMRFPAVVLSGNTAATTYRRTRSAHNRQPWRFVVVRDADIKLRLADAMGVRLKNDRTRDGDDPAAIQRDVARSHLRISEAPVLLAVCLTMEDMDRYPDERRNRAEFLMAVQSTARR
jgi:coenzyme F420-0:L-glutamate ligase / coenzyme F420-1:gamma-L-glutamate ligase